MTPSERAAAWRAAHPITQDPEAQRKIVWDWIAEPETCPYVLHRASFEVRSKRSGRKQQQLLVQGVRMSRAVVTWYLLKDEFAHPDDLDFAPRLQSISLKFALD
jgi:hypothetical protein